MQTREEHEQSLSRLACNSQAARASSERGCDCSDLTGWCQGGRGMGCGAELSPGSHGARDRVVCSTLCRCGRIPCFDEFDSANNFDEDT